MNTPIQLRFNDIDQMGHVNNAVIMEFFDYGKMKYFAVSPKNDLVRSKNLDGIKEQVRRYDE